MFDTTQDSHKAFRDIASERTKSVVLWIGAGLSRTAGLPLWSDLRNHLCEVGLRKAQQRTDPTERETIETKCSVASDLPLWKAFALLRSVLGKTTYNESIKHSLRAAESANVPLVYKKLWHLRPSGILNLNLDRLASRAHREEEPNKGLNETVGKQIAGNFGELLKSPHPFLVYLHGTATDVNSWVMTDGELKGLFRTPGYTDFIKACLATRTLLFVGMSADDVAAGGHLQELTRTGVDAGQHFWVTNRTDEETDAWAESAGIRTIAYRARDNDHSELISFFDDILTFLPSEQFAPPVKLSIPVNAKPPLPEPDQLIGLPEDDDIRLILNAEATRILRDATPEAYSAFESFSRKYDQSIWRAWYVSVDPPHNKLLGFTLLKEIARGAFGKVYLAKKDGSEDELAIKVLHPDIRKDPQLLQSFRRGVRSMEILSTSNVSGMIPYREASEIPAFAVMDFINGPNLSEAVKSGDVSSWRDVLEIATRIASIISSAHELPERVLHRDIRPANIMLRGFYRNCDNYDVLVLDFDLSWHRGASELSVMAPQAVSGFLAPEQVNRDSRVSTRHASVDSFGLGMTLYFMRCGKDPVFSHHRHSDWKETLERNIGAVHCDTWKSLPIRFARLIEASTRQTQPARWDMSQILRELNRLLDAEKSTALVTSAELFAEELARCSDIQDRYTWSDDASEAIFDSFGARFVIRGNEVQNKVEVELYWSRSRGPSVDKYMKAAGNKALAELNKGRWEHVVSDRTSDSLRITADIRVHQLKTALPLAVTTLNNAMRAFSVR